MPIPPESCEAIATHSKMAEESIDFGVDGQAILKNGETFVSVDSCIVDVAGLTITNMAANSTAFTDDSVIPSVNVPAGCGLLLSIAGGVAGQTYKIRIIAVLSTGKKKGGILTLLVK